MGWAEIRYRVEVVYDWDGVAILESGLNEVVALEYHRILAGLKIDQGTDLA
jgi:hypothetical protein